MRLVNAHVINYRSVEDSDLFDVEEDVTCLVGKNESGKTATLRALYRLNPVEPSAKFDLVVDFPAKRSKERKATKGFIPAVKATFELSDAEVELVTEHFGSGALTSRIVRLQRGYRTTGTFDVDYDENKMVAHLFQGLDPTSQQALRPTKTIEEFSEALRELPEPPAAVTGLLARLDKWGGTGWKCLHAILSPKLPKFVYFDDYDSMPGKVSIPDLIRRRDAGQLNRGEQALLSLLGMAGADLEDFQTTNEHEHLVRELENASRYLRRGVRVLVAEQATRGQAAAFRAGGWSRCASQRGADPADPRGQ